jgi:hypothetical protein
MRNLLIQKGAGVAVIEQALAKALPQLVMVRSTAVQRDAEFAPELDALVATLRELQDRVAGARRRPNAASGNPSG